MITTILLTALAITINYDLPIIAERVYNNLSNFFFGGKKLTPKEL